MTRGKGIGRRFADATRQVNRLKLEPSDRARVDIAPNRHGEPRKTERYTDPAGSDYKNVSFGYRNPDDESRIDLRALTNFANNWDGQPDFPLDLSYLDQIDPLDEPDDPRLDPGEKTVHVGWQSDRVGIDRSKRGKV